MNKKPIIYVSTCAIIDSNDRILITSRENRDDFSNCWEFPGGKIEENETPEECLIRELKEEINIDVSNKCIAPIGFSSSYSLIDKGCFIRLTLPFNCLFSFSTS